MVNTSANNTSTPFLTSRTNLPLRLASLVADGGLKSFVPFVYADKIAKLEAEVKQLKVDQGESVRGAKRRVEEAGVLDNGCQIIRRF